MLTAQILRETRGLAEFLKNLSEEEAQQLLYKWDFWARKEQLPPKGDWSTWVIMSGRGFGKSRAGAEWIRKKKDTNGLIALVGETAADVRDVMIEGESGIMAISPDWDRPTYTPSLRKLEWPNGAIAKTYSGEDPDQLRGPQHFCAWIDEFCKMRYAEDTWDNLSLGLRLGDHPQSLITTTPRNMKVLKDIMKDRGAVVTRGSTFDNAANLPDQFIAKIKNQYDGTRIGRQELYAEILEDVDGAMWNLEQIDSTRYRIDGSSENDPQLLLRKLPPMSRIVIGVDPSGARDARSSSDEIGIVVCGIDEHGNIFIIDDLSFVGSPLQWGNRVRNAYYEYGASAIVAEENFGSAMVEKIITDDEKSIRYIGVKATGRMSKHTRAEPIAMQWEKGIAKIVGSLAKLEDQMLNMTYSGYVGKGSPDRLDAMVWAVTDLISKNSGSIDYTKFYSGTAKIG